MPPPRASAFALCVGSLLVLAALGCDVDNPGDEPPLEDLYFPNALAISPSVGGEAPAYLFVANANFDLRFNGGTLQAIDLDAVDAQIENCDEADDCTIPTHEVVEDAVVIGSFATALELSHDGRHLLATTRTDDGLLFVDVDHEATGDAVLECAGGGRCGQIARTASDAAREASRFVWLGEPAAIVSGRLSDWAADDGEASRVDGLEYAVVAHRPGGATLFVEDPAGDGAFVPTASLDGLPGEITGIAYDRFGGLLHLSLAQNTSVARVLWRIGVAIGGSGDDPDPLLSFIYDAGPVQLEGVTPTNDTRDVAFVDAVAGSGVALSEGRALVVARRPSALLVVDVDEGRNAPGLARVKRVTELGAGPSRVVVGEIDGVPMAFISCFDMREIFVVDLGSGLARSVVPNLSGPFELALDAPRKRLYVADFRTSVIRVLDLSPITDDSGEGPTSARLVATIGKAKIVQELQ